MINLDHGAAPPVDPRVIEAMEPCLREYAGNPSSLHRAGVEARNALERARGRVAGLIGADPGEIIFTASGTEADNLAVKGIAQASTNRGRHIVVSSIEHHAVLYAARAMERQGFTVTEVPADSDGVVQPKQVVRAMRDDTVLVSVMCANDETGTIQPVREIAEIAHRNGAVFHTDAVAAMGRLPVDVLELNVDAVSLSARSLNGPPGAGALYVKAGTRLRPQVEGGVQEDGRRGGHENIPAIVGFGRAAELAADELPARIDRLKQLDESLLRGLRGRLPDAAINGHLGLRLPGHINLWIPEADGESVVLMLDARGIAVSVGSSCAAHAAKPSHVLLALGRTAAEARCSLLITAGPDTVESEVGEALDALAEVVGELRAIAGVTV
ncbi:MAG: cysteine desulfurase [Gemmatimonadetes bacterium]|nr:cysteine desulfurase [Gemmatimonadota bacterium]MYA77044.1 cysteine desulfurase [Gemmatimonadota bacterium]MYH19141.1 cysteine desulfurase [Gemmatimonadota bacterium]MYK99018.1 cysteine desulfurase [Gemmatimonadota bacterium]